MVTVREATRDDLEGLLALYVQLSPGNAGTTAASVGRPFEELLAAPHVMVAVAEVSGAVVGTATLVMVPNLTHGGKPWAQLENMVVHESHRGTGVGRAILRSCLETAWAAGCYKVQLQSDNARAGAHSFYEREGFAASSRGYRLYRSD